MLSLFSLYISCIRITDNNFIIIQLLIGLLLQLWFEILRIFTNLTAPNRIINRIGNDMVVYGRILHIYAILYWHKNLYEFALWIRAQRQP